ncbi:MAG TPA: YciI family protein, partial [Streptosporangiaceae bacterium]|nr:YciI family protein [Streptosporangiaceae bacterium]
DAERSAFDAHAAWLRKLLADGLLIAAGPCLGQVNTGIAIFEAASEEEAQRIIAGEPVTGGGYMRGDLRPFRLGLLRGRDSAAGDRPAPPISGQPARRPDTGPPLLALGQDRPDVSGTAFVAPGAVLIGRVTIAAEASVWYGAVLRADRDTIVVGARSNVQDGCVLHADPGVPLSVGSEVTIGHNATLHGCTVEDLVLIGMGAIVLNGTRVGRHSIIAAGTVLTEGQQVPEGVLVAGVPGKVRRDLSEAERAAIGRNAATYVGLSQLHRHGEA